MSHGIAPIHDSFGSHSTERRPIRNRIQHTPLPDVPWQVEHPRLAPKLEHAVQVELLRHGLGHLQLVSALPPSSTAQANLVLPNFAKAPNLLRWAR
jgi:hypothetical protein